MQNALFLTFRSCQSTWSEILQDHLVIRIRFWSWKYMQRQASDRHSLVNEFFRVPLTVATFPLTRKVNPSGLVMQIHSSASSAALSCKPLLYEKNWRRLKEKRSRAFRHLGPFQEIRQELPITSRISPLSSTSTDLPISRLYHGLAQGSSRLRGVVARYLTSYSSESSRSSLSQPSRSQL